MPVPVSNLQVVAAAKIALKQVQGRDVQDNAFTVGRRDPPFAPFTIRGWRAVRMRRGAKAPAVFLKRSATFCGNKSSAPSRGIIFKLET